MPSYRVCFLNEIPRTDKLVRCCQRSIVVRSALSAEQAVEAAKKQFAELEGIRDWKIHAALVEVEAIDLAAQPDRASLGHVGADLNNRRCRSPRNRRRRCMQ